MKTTIEVNELFYPVEVLGNGDLSILSSKTGYLEFSYKEKDQIPELAWGFEAREDALAYINGNPITKKYHGYFEEVRSGLMVRKIIKIDGDDKDD